MLRSPFCKHSSLEEKVSEPNSLLPAFFAFAIGGNFEQISWEEVRCDSPTADPESHHLKAPQASLERVSMEL